jgi:hypothetical protein
MIKKSPIALAALVLLLGAASVTSFPTQSYAQQKKEETVDPLKLEVIRNEWDKPYKEIQKLIDAKQFAEALEIRYSNCRIKRRLTNYSSYKEPRQS